MDSVRMGLSDRIRGRVKEGNQSLVILDDSWLYSCYRAVIGLYVADWVRFLMALV